MALNTARQERQRQVAELASTFEPEELDPELAEYVQEHPKLGLTLRHPLVYSIMYHPIENKRLNAMLKAKQERVAELRAQGNARAAVWYYERPYRLEAFLEFAPLISDHHYWQLLGDLWTDAENVWQNRELWQDVLTADRPRRWAFMDKPERDHLKSLRRCPVLIYRGYSWPDGLEGMSWTLERKRAEWFARRLLGIDPDVQQPMLAVAAVDHRDIIAYKACRNESEVIVLPDDVKVVRVEELSAL